jgi:5-methylcytosine-specific restriction endonuclease McrA
MAAKRNVTEGNKKLVAGRQRYKCAASVVGYKCPLRGRVFDESGYEVDHIIRLADGGSNEPDNLQALCAMCHSVKSKREAVGKKLLKKAAPKKKEWSIKNTEIGYLYDSDPDMDVDD